MSHWGSAKARVVRAALAKLGWREVRQAGSHVILRHEDYADFTWAFHDGVELGPRMLARIAKVTGLEPRDL